MGAVKENFPYDAELVKNFLQIDNDEPILELFFEAAKEDADNYCNNPFLVDGEVVIPATVKLWVLRRMARYYEHRVSGVRSQSDAMGSIAWHPEDFEGLHPYRIYPGF